MACKTLPIGFGTNVNIALLDGSCVIPAVQTGEDPANTLTTSGGATAKGSTSITISAVPTDVTIPSGSYLVFTDATGNAVMVRTSAIAVPTDTTLTVEATPAAIADASTAKFPVVFGGRTNAGVDVTGNTVTSSPFEEGGFETVNATTQSSSISFDGNFLETDAGVWTAIRSLLDKTATGGWITRPAPDSRYQRGTQFSGQIVITGTPVDIPSDGIVTLNVAASFTGAPVISEPLATV